jgi:hypothetical protein
MFSDQFERFDPLLGDVPFFPFSCLPEIAFRARTLLESHTIEQITSIAIDISQNIDEYLSECKHKIIAQLENDIGGTDKYEVYFEWDGGSYKNGRYLFNEDMLDELNIETWENINEVDILKIISGNWNNILMGYVENKDFELFSVLSLWLLSNALSFQDKTPTSLSLSGEYALKAMDAVCYAEHLCDSAFLVSNAKNTCSADAVELHRLEKSNNSQKLNMIRHKTNHAAKALVIAEFDKDHSKFPSADKWGTHLADWLIEKGFNLQPRTIATHIRAHAKKTNVRLR